MANRAAAGTAIDQIKSYAEWSCAFRAKGTLTNKTSSYQGVSIRPDNQIFLAPEQRVVMW